MKPFLMLLELVFIFRMSKILIIDLYGILFRSYYGVPEIRVEKVNYNGVFGTLKSLLAILKNVQYDKLFIAKDSGKETFRSKIFQEYKKNRPSCPEDLKPQFKILDDFIDSMGIFSLRVDGYEADDIIASASFLATKNNDEVIISTLDKDLMQLVKDGIKLYNYKTNSFIDEEKVFACFGVKPSQISDYLALIGDSSDNISGVKGIGEKKAIFLLNMFENLNDIYSNLDQISDKKIVSLLKEGQGDAFLSLKLTKLEPFSEINDKINLNSIAKVTLEKNLQEILKCCEKYNVKQIRNLFPKKNENGSFSFL